MWISVLKFKQHDMNTITYPFTLHGVVKPFSGNGRKFGYSTANIEVPIDTPEGIFVGWTTLNNKKLASVQFIGQPITVGDTIKRAESHIFDFEDRDLYGESIQLIVLEKLRDNIKFDSINELLEQMKKDEQTARLYFDMLMEV